MVRIGIIGAGISGLSTAFYISKFLREEKENFILGVFEKEERPGGTIISQNKAGFLVEGGPNGFLDSKPSTLHLCSELNLNSKLLPANSSSQRRYIFLKDRLILVPEKPVKFLKSDIMSFKGKIRLFMEGAIRKGIAKKDETVSEFGRRRIGREAVENLLDPMVTGIFAGDPETMSLKACFPRIWEMEQKYGSLTKAMISIMRERKTSGPAGPGGTLTSFLEGTEYLIKKLAEEESSNIKLNSEVRAIDYSCGRWFVNNENSPYDVIVSAAPSYVLAELIKPLSSSLFEKAVHISYSPMAVIGLGYKKEAVENKIDGFGFLIPHKERRKILGCLFSSQIFPGRAPEGYELLQVMAGGARFSEIVNYSNGQILDFSIQELKSILGIGDSPDFIKIFRYPLAIPQYKVGHLILLEQLKKELHPFKGLFFTGNAYYGVGINDCTKNSREIAQSAIAYLTGREND
ncbi:MAG: protoporphyrinogen oxidase [Candidatus Aminicenantales bacterium]